MAVFNTMEKLKKEVVTTAEEEESARLRSSVSWGNEKNL